MSVQESWEHNLAEKTAQVSLDDSENQPSSTRLNVNATAFVPNVAASSFVPSWSQSDRKPSDAKKSTSSTSVNDSPRKNAPSSSSSHNSINQKSRDSSPSRNRSGSSKSASNEKVNSNGAFADDGDPDGFYEHMETVNLVFIGHVDAGKSTMGGHILFITGQVDKRTMEKYEKEAKEANRESWYLSWALDTNAEERAKGKTVEVGRATFETAKRRFIVLDAPGHKNYVPNMIGGAAQADIGILVISARKGEFEAGFQKEGQTREHAILAKTAGVRKLIVAINKMDDPTVQWKKERYDECVNGLTPFLRQCGFNPKTDLVFMPVSAFTGVNLKDRITSDLCPWYKGDSLLTTLDNIELDTRPIDGPLIIPVSEKYKDMGVVLGGKIESGKIKRGDTLSILPPKHNVEVSNLYLEEDEVNQAICGDFVRIRLKGSNVDEDDVSQGFVVIKDGPETSLKATTSFVAQLIILEHKSIITAGYSAMFHVHTLVEEVSISALLHLVDKKTKKQSKHAPRFVKKGQMVLARLETPQPVCITTFKDLAQLGRFTLRDEGKTIAMGKITKINTE